MFILYKLKNIKTAFPMHITQKKLLFSSIFIVDYLTYSLCGSLLPLTLAEYLRQE